MIAFIGRAARMKFGAILAAFLFATFFTFGAADATRAKDVELDPARVKQFLASYPDVKAIAIRRATEEGSKIAESDDTLSAVLQLASDDSAKTEIEDAVQPYGFKGAKQWFQVAQAISRTYAHLKVGASDAKAQKKLRKAIAKIEENDFLSDKQKRKFVQAITSGAGIVLDAPSDQNVAAVKPMMDEIAAAVK